MSHKPHYKFVTQTMLEINERETDLYHKRCYKFFTKTMINADEPEIYFRLINFVTNLAYKKHICLINHVMTLPQKPY